MRPVLVLLGGLAATLAVVIAAELATPFGADDAAAEATGVKPAVRLPAIDPARAGVQAEDRTDAWVATIMARPLFTRDRRPADAHTAAAAGGGPGTLPRLTGIAVSPFGRSAIFAADTGKPLVVSEGGSVGAFTVRAIHPGTVDLQGPAGAQTLAPVFDPNPRKVDLDSQAVGQTDQQGQIITQPGMPRPPNMVPGFRGMPLPQFRIPGAPVLPPSLRPRVGDGAQRGPLPFDRAPRTASRDTAPAGRPAAA